MAKTAFASGLGFFLCCTLGAARADLYGYVDEDGRTHVSNQRLNERYVLFQRLPGAAPAPAKQAAPSVQGAPEAGATLPRINLAERRKYVPLVKRVAQRYNVEAALIHAIISAESAYNPLAVSPRGASGLMQLMPDTAQQYGVTDIYNPHQNIIAGVKHLRYLMKVFDNDLSLTLAAYNAGHNTVLKYGRVIPPFRETLTYVPRVLAFYRKYQAEI